VDDDLDLLGDEDGDGASKGRPWGLLAAALAAVLVAVSGLLWAVASMTGGGGTGPVAASAPATTVAPSAPTTTSPAPSPTPSSTPAGTRSATPTPAPTGSPSAERTAPRTTAPAPPATASPRPTPTRRLTLPPPQPLAVRVPDVTGQRVAGATLILRAAGFRVAVPPGAAPKPDQRRVRAQTPAGGTLAPRGTTVTLLLDSS
jgi:hypothetical protein